MCKKKRKNKKNKWMPKLGFTFWFPACESLEWTFVRLWLKNFHTLTLTEIIFHSNVFVYSCPSTEAATPLFGTAGKHLSQWIFHSVSLAAGRVNACVNSNVQLGVGDLRTHNLPCMEVKYKGSKGLFFVKRKLVDSVDCELIFSPKFQFQSFSLLLPTATECISDFLCNWASVHI